MSFRRVVLDWFKENSRDLPWRRTRNPYRILVSELMLQQTQVSRVLPYYDAFLKAFPTVEILAQAETASVLRLWQGLGYNRRALYLQGAADAVSVEHAGVFPRSIRELETLPGVGSYTARAIACFAFELPVAVVETNVRSAIDSFAERCEWAGRIDYQRTADDLLVQPDPWRWNQAMIDFGALAVTSAHRRDTKAPKALQPFEETNRYWRGRILALLCGHVSAIPTEILLQQLPPPSEEYRVRTLIGKLSEEGLVQYDSGTDMIRLPGTQ